MEISNFKFLRSIFGKWTVEGQKDEYLDPLIRHILRANLSRFSPPPETWICILRRIESQTLLPSSREEVQNGSYQF